MEEPQEVHTDEHQSNPEKKPKRTVKTRFQLDALENFYNEHKYPNEALKAQLAESIGLTEKQVSGWFCHRRLKDKRLPPDDVGPHGKQDRSSGVIQDRGSGLRQDSCGSTKQGDNKHHDLKEVESRRFITESLLPVEVRFDHGGQHNSIMGMENDDHVEDDDDDNDDDTSSGSSSPLNDFRPQNMDRLATLTTQYPTYNDLKSVKGRPGPSGYLKLKGQVENAAITAVKRQLGRNYKEDGPPLGIEFEQLPPGAFESPVKVPVNQSYYVSDHTALHPLEMSRTFQLSNGSKMHERYSPKSYDPVDLNESGLETRHTSKHHEKSQYKSAPPNLKHSRHALSERSLQMVVANDDSGGETSVQDNRLERTVMKHGPGVNRRPDSSSTHFEKSQYKSAPPSFKHSRHAMSDRSLQMVVANDDSSGENIVQDNRLERTMMKHGPGVNRRPDSSSTHFEKSQYKSAPPSFKHSRHAMSDRSLQMVVANDDSGGETSVHDNRLERTMIKHGPGVNRKPDSSSNHHLIGYGENFDGKQAENYSRSGPPKVNYRGHVEPLTSDFTYKRGEVLQPEDRVLSRKAPKDDEFDRGRRGIDDYSKLVSPRIHPGNEMRVTKRSRDEFMQQVYPMKEALVDFPLVSNKTKRPTAQMTSSFSDDETAETTSSGD